MKAKRLMSPPSRRWFAKRSPSTVLPSRSLRRKRSPKGSPRMGAPRSGFFCLGWAFLTPLSVTPNGIIDLRPITEQVGSFRSFAHTNSREGAFVLSSPLVEALHSPRIMVPVGPTILARKWAGFPLATSTETPSFRNSLAKSSGFGLAAAKLSRLQPLGTSTDGCTVPAPHSMKNGSKPFRSLSRLSVSSAASFRRASRAIPASDRETPRRPCAKARRPRECQLDARPNPPAWEHIAASTSPVIPPSSWEFPTAPDRARSPPGNATAPMPAGHCGFPVPDAHHPSRAARRCAFLRTRYLGQGRYSPVEGDQA